MRILVQIIINIVVVNVISAFTLADFDIPGIMSNKYCEDNVLRKKFEPICKCKQTHQVTDAKSLCRSHADFGHCIEHNINLDTFGFLKHTFNRKLFEYTLNHICEETDSADGITTCTTPEKLSLCTIGGMKIKNYTSIDEKTSCLFLERTAECVLNTSKSASCPPNVSYFWSKLSQAFMDTKCTTYLPMSRAYKCSQMLKAVHPKQRDYNYERCLEVVEMRKSCFLIERRYSIHHYDVWYNKGFELERHIKFEKFRCLIQEDRKKDIDCETPRRLKDIEQCRNNHNDGFYGHVDRIKNGTDVSIPEICGLYEKLTSCIQQALKDCPKANSEHQLANYCGQMPVACDCPIKLERNSAILIMQSAFTLFLMSLLSIIFM
ncbi:hypothetical protein ACF0H5_010461 [Mactra antiquata]